MPHQGLDIKWYFERSFWSERNSKSNETSMREVFVNSKTIKKSLWKAGEAIVCLDCRTSQ